MRAKIPELNLALVGRFGEHHARMIRHHLDHIDHLGGTIPAIEAGYIQQQIQDAAYRAQQAVDSGDAVVVGVNRFEDGTAPPTDVFRIDPDIERRQVERVRAVRASRSQREWRAALDAVDAAARGTTNLAPPIIAAVEARATLGEIADAMRAVFGEHQDASPVASASARP